LGLLEKWYGNYFSNLFSNTKAKPVYWLTLASFQAAYHTFLLNLSSEVMEIHLRVHSSALTHLGGPCLRSDQDVVAAQPSLGMIRSEFERAQSCTAFTSKHTTATVHHMMLLGWKPP